MALRELKMAEVIRDRDGKVIQRSRNLAGIRRYVCRNLIRWIKLSHYDNSVRPVIPGIGAPSRMFIEFDNGATFETHFADWTILCDWVRRWQSAYGAPLMIDGRHCDVVRKDNADLLAEINRRD